MSNGRRLRRTGRTPIEDNTANWQNSMTEACMSLSREGSSSTEKVRFEAEKAA